MTHWSDGTPRANANSGESEQGDLVEETQTETPESDCGDVEQTTEEQNDQLTEQGDDIVQPADNTEPTDANTEQQDDNVVEEQNDQLTEQVGCETFDDPVEADDAQLSSLREQYERYGDQIAQLSSEKEYYPADGKEWNSLMDEKIAAQNQVSERINELMGRRNRLLAERENKNN
jgi:chromosome segregation ATPase